MITRGAGVHNVFRTWGDFPATAGDFTIFLRFKQNTPGAGAGPLLILFDGATDYTAPYLYLGTLGATDTMVLEAYDGVSFFDTPSTAITAGDQDWVAATYVASTHVLTLIVNGSTIGTTTVNLSPFTWDSLYVIGDPGGGIDYSAAYCRSWSSVLSGAQLTAEAASMTAVVTSGLLWDCPLQASIDLTAHNNSLNQLIATGTVTTDTDDPLLSVVAGPPTNLDPTTALTLTTDSAVFQDVLAAGLAATVWCKVTAPAASVVMGICGYGGLGAYQPSTIIYEGLTNAINGDAAFGGAVGQNKPMQFPVTPGTDYYFRFAAAGPQTTPILQVSALVALNLPVSIGDLGINDDAEGLPLAILDRATGYPIRYVNPFPTGEHGRTLPDGTLLMFDNINAQQDVFTPTIQEIATISSLPYFDNVSDDGTDTFFVGTTLHPAASDAQVTTISKLGVIGSRTWTLTGSLGMWCSSVNRGQAKFYWVENSNENLPVQTWDLVNDVALANLAAGVASYAALEDIVVLGDNTILVGYVKTTATRDLQIRHYAANGTLLGTYDYGSNVSGLNDNRFCADVTDATFVTWIRPRTPGGTSQFITVDVTTMTAQSTVTGMQYERCQYNSSPNDTPVRFGHSESCPIWVVRSALATVLRMTQLPVEIAYDYAGLQPFVSGGGLNWVTPPKTLTS